MPYLPATEPSSTPSAFRYKATLFLRITPAPSPSFAASVLKALSSSDLPLRPVPKITLTRSGVSITFRDQPARWAAQDAAHAGWLPRLTTLLGPHAPRITLSTLPGVLLLDTAGCFAAFSASMSFDSRALLVGTTVLKLTDAAELRQIALENPIVERGVPVLFRVLRAELRPSGTLAVLFQDAQVADFFAAKGGMRWPRVPGVVLPQCGLFRCTICGRRDHELQDCRLPRCRMCGFRGRLAEHQCLKCDKCGRLGRLKEDCWHGGERPRAGRGREKPVGRTEAADAPEKSTYGPMENGAVIPKKRRNPGKNARLAARALKLAEMNKQAEMNKPAEQKQIIEKQPMGKQPTTTQKSHGNQDGPSEAKPKKKKKRPYTPYWKKPRAKPATLEEGEKK